MPQDLGLERDFHGAGRAARQADRGAMRRRLEAVRKHRGVSRRHEDHARPATGEIVHRLDGIVAGRVDGVGGAAAHAVLKTLIQQVNSDHRVGAGPRGEVRGELPDEALSEHRHRLPQVWLGAPDPVQRDIAQDAESRLLRP